MEYSHELRPQPNRRASGGRRRLLHPVQPARDGTGHREEGAMKLYTVDRLRTGAYLSQAQAEADERRRAERDEGARRWLTTRGHIDLLPILGLALPACELCGAEIKTHAGSPGMCQRCRQAGAAR